MSPYFWYDLINLIIFIFIIVSVLTIKFWSPNNRKHLIAFILVYCSFNVLIGFNVFGGSGGRRTSRMHECFDNCKDFKYRYMSYISKHKGEKKGFSFKELKKDGCIDKDFIKPSPNCEYIGIGDLEWNGLVCCLYHGIPRLTNRDFFDFNDSVALKYITNNGTDEEIEQIKKEIEQAKSSVKDDNLWERWEKFISYRKNLFIVRLFFFPFTLLPNRAMHLN